MIRDVEDDSKGDFVATKLSIKIPSSKNQIPRKVTRNKRQITNNRQMPITNNQARDNNQELLKNGVIFSLVYIWHSDPSLYPFPCRK